MDIFAPYLKINGCFVVLNKSSQVKTISIFNYPINYGCTRDLLQIPGVAENDIRASLLKGELNHKIRAGDIDVVCSDIDLLQFNSSQKLFLQNSGIVNGLEVTADQMAIIEQQDIQLVGSVNDVNTVFKIPSGTWIQTAPYKIIVYKNGVKQVLSDDYIIAESGGPGTGYDTVIFNVPPQTTPTPIDVITADYYIHNV
jgi:hypothetical protein